MKAVLGDMGLEVHRTTDGSTLGADVWGLVLVDGAVSKPEFTLAIGQKAIDIYWSSAGQFFALNQT